MEQYTSLLIAFIGGGIVPLVFNAVLNRKKAGTDLNVDRDGEIMKWLDKALHVADELLAAKTILHETKVRLDDCEKRREKCNCGPQ